MAPTPHVSISFLFWTVNWIWNNISMSCISRKIHKKLKNACVDWKLETTDMLHCLVFFNTSYNREHFLGFNTLITWINCTTLVLMDWPNPMSHKKYLTYQISLRTISHLSDGSSGRFLSGKCHTTGGWVVRSVRAIPLKRKFTIKFNTTSASNLSLIEILLTIHSKYIKVRHW